MVAGAGPDTAIPSTPLWALGGAITTRMGCITASVAAAGMAGCSTMASCAPWSLP